jgi:hypothetical protein
VAKLMTVVGQLSGIVIGTPKAPPDSGTTRQVAEA